MTSQTPEDVRALVDSGVPMESVLTGVMWRRVRRGDPDSELMLRVAEASRHETAQEALSLIWSDWDLMALTEFIWRPVEISTDANGDRVPEIDQHFTVYLWQHKKTGVVASVRVLGRVVAFSGAQPACDHRFRVGTHQVVPWETATTTQRVAHVHDAVVGLHIAANMSEFMWRTLDAWEHETSIARHGFSNRSAPDLMHLRVLVLTCLQVPARHVPNSGQFAGEQVLAHLDGYDWLPRVRGRDAMVGVPVSGAERVRLRLDSPDGRERRSR